MIHVSIYPCDDWIRGHSSLWLNKLDVQDQIFYRINSAIKNYETTDDREKRN